jgi:O-antigen ligase
MFDQSLTSESPAFGGTVTAAELVPPSRPRAASGNSLGFALFILVNAFLFVRPAEIFPEVADLEQTLGVQLYQVSMLTCLAFSLSAVGEQLNPSILVECPVTVCVLGLVPAIILSHVSHFGFFGEALRQSFAYIKVALYYLLLVANVNTTARMRWFLSWLLLFIVVLAGLALLQYHGYINLAVLETLEAGIVRDDGDVIQYQRLRSTGIYHDPNDLCIILVTGILISLYQLMDRGSRFLAPLWLALVGMFGYAIVLTVSRGGLIGLGAGLGVLFACRFGWRKALTLALLCAPLGLLFFKGEAWTERDTSQTRIQLWSEGLVLFRQAPLFGIGMGNYADEAVQVAHNSFIHCFTELGFFGGTLFLGAFYLAVREVYRYGRGPFGGILDPDLRRLQPYVLAIVAAAIAGMMSLSRSYVTPTYMYLALPTAFLQLASGSALVPVQRFDSRLVRRLVIIGVLFLLTMQVFVRTFVHFGE